MSFLIRLQIPLLAAIVAAAAAMPCRLGAEPPEPPLREAAQGVSYRDHVWPIFKRHCWGCHSSQDPKGGLDVGSVQAMLTGGDSGPLFEPGKPDESMLLFMITGDEPEMPKKQPPLSAEKIDVLRRWVRGGAKDDSLGGSGALAVEIPATYRRAPAVTSVALSPDGKRVAAACRSEVVVHEIGSNQPGQRLATESDLLTHVQFSPDGKVLAAAGGSPARYGEVRFFDAATGELLSSRRLGSDTLFRGDFAPDGKTIALGGADGAVHIVPVQPDAAVRSFDLHSDWVLDVAFTPDGKMLVSGGRDKATKVSAVDSGRLLRSVDESPELISSVAADGQFAVSAGRARRLTGYELKIALSGIEVTGAGNGARPISKQNQYTKNFETQPGEVLDIATSADRKHLATAGDYGDIRVYTVADRKRVTIISGVAGPVYSIALSADGTRLAAGSKQGIVQIYELPEGELLETISPVPVQAPAEN